MSFASSLLITFLKLSRMKKRLAKRSLKELHQSLSLPDPPKSVRKICATEKIEFENVNGHWLNRKNNATGILVYLHGGGYTYGPIDFQWEYIAQMSLQSGMAALVIDYKQLPDFPFPFGLNEIISVLTNFIHTKIIPDNYFILGDSAGGSLAIAACYQLQKANIRLPEKLILMSPQVDIRCQLAENKNTGEDPIISLSLIEKIKKAYCLHHNPEDPLISPLFGNLKILPPMLLQCGTREILLSDIRRFHSKCLEAKIKIQYEEYPGMIHVFPTMRFLPEAKKAQQSQLKFLLEK
jgi:monoterpene epsilon-lactone hydrolase